VSLILPTICGDGGSLVTKQNKITIAERLEKQ
jgi:hypothetical protein